jgi:hypothetical protein
VRLNLSLPGIISNRIVTPDLIRGQDDDSMHRS